MKRPWILIVIAANLCGLLLLVFVYPALMVAPGPLIPAHAALTQDCFACHAPLRGAAPERCVGCHKLPEIGLRTTTGASLMNKMVKASFHQDLKSQDCMACHSDHDGPLFSRRGRTAFTHALLRTPTEGRCETCHTAPQTAIHRGADAGCGQCHGQQAWTPASFDHAKLFALQGDHAAPCLTCHVAANFKAYTCYGCHEHQPDKIRAKHVKEGIQNFENCVSCHRSAGKREGRSSSGRGEED